MGTVDRLLANAQSGDWDAFRKETQTLANGRAGRDMRAQAGLTVDRQEQQATTQQAAQQAAQIEQPAHRGQRMH